MNTEEYIRHMPGILLCLALLASLLVLILSEAGNTTESSMDAYLPAPEEGDQNLAGYSDFKSCSNDILTKSSRKINALNLKNVRRRYDKCGS